jgi:P-type Cu2+ transporter
MEHHSHEGHTGHEEHHMHGQAEPVQAHDKHAGHDVNALWRKFKVVLVLTIPVVVYSMGIEKMLHYTAPQFPGSTYVPAVFGTIIFFYGGLFFLKGAVSEFRAKLPGMMTLISLAITVAFIFSLRVTIKYPEEALFWELSTLILIMLLGHYIEMKAIGSASDALTELARLLPDEAERIEGERTEIVRTGGLKVGDVVLIRPGAKIPSDGVVIDGESNVNESMITGESSPVRKSTGDSVIAGTVNQDGSLRAKIEKIGSDTALAGIMRLVSEAQNSKSEAQTLADRAAMWLTFLAMWAGAATFYYWFMSSLPVEFVYERTVTVLVIACPHALGLAIPLVIAISTTLAAKNGLLVRDRLALEMARILDVVVFDKTGTLTKGEPGVVGVYAASGVGEDAALSLMASLEHDSEHAIARAIVKSASEKKFAVPEAHQFRALPGLGVEAEIEGRTLSAGGPRFLESLNLIVPSELEEPVKNAKTKGHTLVYLIDEGAIKAVVALADVIRPESKEAIAELNKMGVSVAMLTGDSEEVAKWVADELGIKEYFANVLPEDKERKIKETRWQGRKVAMVGDGVNDAPALAAADVGIAIGAGTDVAIEAGGIILARNDPRDIPKIIRLSRATYRKMIQNLIWATGYNVVAIPLAAGALYNQGIVLAPAVGAVLMSASTVIVAVNAQLLRRLNLRT